MLTENIPSIVAFGVSTGGRVRTGPSAARHSHSLLRRWSCTCAALIAILAVGLSAPALGKKPAKADTGEDGKSADEFLIVDCLLPGQVRKLGQRMNYLSPRRPVKTSASDCEIRGGEYVAFDRADYSTALKIWLPQAKEGDPEAQTYVGEIYEKGLGLDPDYQFAAYWYQQAVQQGHSRALINLGHLYELGLGVERDPRKALNLYREASGIEGDKLLFASSLVSSHVPRENFETVQGELAREKQHSTQLEQQLARVNRDMERRSAELTKTESQLQSTAEKLQTVTSAAAVGTVAAAVPSARETALVSKLDALELERVALAQQVAQLDNKNQQLEKSRAALSGQLSGKEQDQQQAREQLAQLQSEVQQSRQQLDKSQQEASALKQALAEQQSSQSVSDASLRQLQADLDAKNAELAGAQSQYNALQASSHEREQALAAGSEDYSREYQREKARLDQELSQREQQLEDAGHQLLLAKAALQMERARAGETLATQTSEQRALQARQQAEMAEFSAQLESQSALVKSQKRKIEELEQESAQYTDSREAAAGANQVAAVVEPPKIEIIEPPVVLMRSMPTVTLMSKDDQRQVVGKVLAPAGILSLSVNGKPVSPGSNNLFRANIVIDAAPKPVNVVVVDKQGRRAAVTFTFVENESASKPQASSTAAIKAPRKSKLKLGDYYALIIGNNDYQQFSTLATAVNDARETDRLLRTKYNFKTRLLLNADRYTILSALNELRETLDEHDNLLIYYAGHGILDETNDRGYWLPVDADTNNNANWISNTAITDMLNVIEAKHILVVADSCFSGTLTQSPLARTQAEVPADVRTEWIEVMAETRARITLTSGGLEPVLDGGGGDHSLFAKAFLAALRDNEGILEGYSLYYQVLDRMGTGTQSVSRGVTQVPQYAPIHLAGHESGEFFFSPI